MKTHLVAGLYRLPRDLRTPTVAAATAAANPREVITTVAAILDQDYLAGLISSNSISPAPVGTLPPPPAPEYPNPTMSLAVDQVKINSPIPALAAGYHRDPCIQKSRQYARRRMERA